MESYQLIEGVAGTNVSAFVERCGDREPTRGFPKGVAGTNVSAFVERRCGDHRTTFAGWVSPGLTSRPSLSDRLSRQPHGRGGGVAGTNVSAFVERAPRSGPGRMGCRVAGTNVSAFVERSPAPSSRERRRLVSPGLTSRPSLSDVPDVHPVGARHVSPGLTSRPSLSGPLHAPPVHDALVSPGLTSRPSLSGGRGPGPAQDCRVSPGLTSRPSLSAIRRLRLRRPAQGCRRD